MNNEDTSADDVSDGPDLQIDLISALRKDNFELHSKIGKLTAELQNSQSLNNLQQNNVLRLKEANSEINDLKCRLQIAINQFQELKQQHSNDDFHQNKIFNDELLRVNGRLDQMKIKNNSLIEENNNLKQEIEKTSQQRDVDMAYIQNQVRSLLSAAESYFKKDFQKFDQLKDHFLNNYLPPSVLPDKEKAIEALSNKILILKKKCKNFEKEKETEEKKHLAEINQLNQKIQLQNNNIAELNLKFEDQANSFQKKLIHIIKKVPKPKKLHKFTSPTISIIPSFDRNCSNKNIPKTPPKEDKCKLIEQLNSTISQLHEENRQNQAYTNKLQIENQKMKLEIESKKSQESFHSSEIETLKREYELKLKCANDVISDLKLSKKEPDVFTEKLITAAKSKIRQQRDELRYKNQLFSNFKNENDQFRLKISEQNVEIIRLKAALNKPPENCLNSGVNVNNNGFSESNSNKQFSEMEIERFPKPFITVFNYSEVNPKLQTVLRPIIDNANLSADAKLQVSLKKVSSYFTEKVEKMRKYKKIIVSCDQVIADLASLIIGRIVNLETLAKNAEVQSQIVASLKEKNKKIDELQNQAMNQNNENKKLKRKLCRAKDKCEMGAILQKRVESLQNELQEILVLNEQLKIENEEMKKNNIFLKNENVELNSALEYERCHMIQVKKEKSSSLDEYEELLQKMKKKCSKQKRTIKNLASNYY